MKIYAASSWRNHHQPELVRKLRQYNHEVYDFRNPKPDNSGFSWSDIDPNWKNWSPIQFINALMTDISIEGHKLDQEGMEWCDVCILLLPCGNSAHLEAGWCMGRGKPVCVYIPDTFREPELMYRTFIKNNIPFPFCLNFVEVLQFLDYVQNNYMPTRDEGLTFAEYQLKSWEKRAKAPDPVFLPGLGLGLTGEAGEVADLLKKVLIHGHDFNREKFIEELGDVVWYVSALAKAKSIPLIEIFKKNLLKLNTRYPNGFSTRESIERKDESR